MIYVVSGYNVVAILSTADMVCLDCTYTETACGVHEQCWICMVNIVLEKFIAAGHVLSFM